MPEPVRYAFISNDSAPEELGFRPFLPIVLSTEQHTVSSSGLLDTGATVNVLPYSIGVELGYEWERQTKALNLTGNLAQYEARVVVVQATIAELNPISLVFAWTRATTVPMILGQVNFFMEFNVCFYRSQLQFEISPKAPS
ncbi:aspartyl protease family protein [Leptolyngbya sp. NIES-2104]|uniref:aspartyl protease family protein n=1 Tax=Leptolyngbya sp. NIES-2104 TaxID=1552121 RepID=UPI0006EC9C47|nr:hypothetical protein [Leptolyngbya sp. NIES-2104]GAP93553.1 hypothetical protein NIES2104_00590 [Leptolyngbya sp. NIES-2104]